MTEARHASYPGVDEIDEPVTRQDLKDAVKDAFKEVDPYAPTVWGQEVIKEFTFTLPSGQKILMTKLDPIDMIANDLVDDMDYFSKKLFPQSLDRAGNPIEQPEEEKNPGLWSMIKDPEKRDIFFKLINKMAVAGVLKPALSLEKDVDGKIFVENIPFEDRMAIFTKLQEPMTKVGSFRQEPPTSVEPVESVESVQHAS